MARFKRCDRCGVEVPYNDDGVANYELVADGETVECRRDLCGGCVMRVIDVMQSTEAKSKEQR
jgi:hypothetical protein